MPFDEADLLPISALQHLLYCDRQCALIHVERLWAENRFTTEGNILHRRAHSGKSDSRPAAKTSRGLPVRSLTLGLCGVADVVLYDRSDDGAIVPVEYKRGRPKKNDCDRVQLCAQALCLEEMHGRSLPVGEIFYGKTKRRVRVEFTPELRRITLDATTRLHDMIRSRRTPPADPGPKCDRCSLRDLCLPRLGGRVSRRGYSFDREIDALLADPSHPDEASQ